MTYQEANDHRMIAFEKLQLELSAMQIELQQRNWSDEERIQKAMKMRNDMWAAIEDYRDAYMELAQGMRARAEATTDVQD